MNWFQRHLNWTWVFAYLIWIPLNASDDAAPQIIGSIFLLLLSGWVIKQKGRRLWWILLTIVFSPLWLSNKKKKLASSQKLTMPLIQRAKTGTGCFVQTTGGILWLGCGLYIMFYQIGVIYDAFGFWLAALAFMFFPIVYVFAFFIDWFIIGIFPVGIFILWLVSWVGMLIMYAGSRIRGEVF